MTARIVLMSDESVTIERCVDNRDEQLHLFSGPYCFWGSGDFQFQPPLSIMSESMVLPWLRSVLRSGSCIVLKCHIEGQC